MTGKKLKSAYEKIEKTKNYPLAEALGLLIEHSKTNFDATAEIHFTLGIDPRHADQQIRSTISLPHGTGKKIRVVALCSDEQKKEAKDAGAIESGGSEIIEKITAKNWTDFDVLVATPDMMKELAKAARVLGPKGLMPNPKTGTLTPHIAQAIKELIAGRIEFKNDKYGIIHTIFGKVSFGKEKLLKNLDAIIQAIKDNKPSGQKGIYIKKITINSTMGAGISLAID